MAIQWHNLPRDDSKLGAERAVFVGAVGSGKTYGALRVCGALYGTRQILIMDTKADPNIAKLDGPVVKTASGLGRYRDAVKFPLIIYRPVVQELEPAFLDQVCQWIYDRQDTILLIDEVTQVTGGKTQPGLGLLNAITRGRSRHVSVFSCSQRPVMVPPIVFTESEWLYAFYLRRKTDIATVDDYTEDGFVERVISARKQGVDHAVGVYAMASGGRIYPSIQAALSGREL